jgi:hypothetical protein
MNQLNCVNSSEDYKIQVRKDHIADLENKRTILDLDEFVPGDVSFKHVFGILLYIFIFVFVIPYHIMRTGQNELLLTYIPNVDMIATVLGYHGGPTIFNIDNMWKYLYNPSNFTLIGFISTSIMNYFALLGATFIVAWTTYKTRSWKIGWSSAFIFLIMTYLAPANPIVILQEKLGTYLEDKAGFSEKSNSHYIVVVIFGLLLVSGIILIESIAIHLTTPYIIKLIDAMNIHLE